MRVAISWWSNPDTPQNNYSFDRLDVDLDLRIFDPNGQAVTGAYSGSFNNNYEIVEFFAPSTGQYSIGVFNYRFDETRMNFLGIAFTKAPTTPAYLPDIRPSTSGNWDSEIFVRNAGSVRIAVRNSAGSLLSEYTCAGFATRVCKYNPSGDFTGYAVVYGSKDVSVIVQTTRNSNQELTNYTGILPQGAPSHRVGRLPAPRSSLPSLRTTTTAGPRGSRSSTRARRARM